MSKEDLSGRCTLTIIPGPRVGDFYWASEPATLKDRASPQALAHSVTLSMSHLHTVRIHDRQRGIEYTVRVPDDRYILHTAESQAIELPFACRNGACTTCAVRVKSGVLHQPEAMGLSPQLQQQGYALLCVSYPRSDLEVETQDEDEVYELQFGRHFGKGRVRFGLPLDEE